MLQLSRFFLRCEGEWMLYQKDSKISRPLFASAYIWHFAFLSTNRSIFYG